MRAVLILVLLAVTAAGAEARTHRPTVVAQVDVADATDTARATVRASEERRATLAASKAQIAIQYAKELAGIDKLKRQKSSWRRDRKLKEKLAASLETAKALSRASKAVTAADKALAKQRKALVAAIDAELAAGADGARARSLRALRAQVAPTIAPKKAKKIVLPDDELDPLADPDELDDQAAALRAGEDELARQVASLERQAERFQQQADLREAHARAGELATRDDDQPRRTSGAGGAAGDSAATDGAPQEGGLGDPSFEGDPAVVLSDVVDSDTVDALRKAERSTDPAAKAAAAQQARDQVAKRLEKLAKRRKEIEARARALRE